MSGDLANKITGHLKIRNYNINVFSNYFMVMIQIPEKFLNEFLNAMKYCDLVVLSDKLGSGGI
jgi:hypothetical protein